MGSSLLEALHGHGLGTVGVPQFMVVVVVLLAVIAILYARQRRSRSSPYAYLYRKRRGRLIKHGICSEVCRIGRHPHNELRLKHKSISRFHAEIVRHANGTFRIHDANSKNGVRVGYRPVDSSLLHEGDLIQIGGVRLQFSRYPYNYNRYRRTILVDVHSSQFDTRRRRVSRQNVAMSVRIYNDESGWINGRVRNLGSEGAFVETDRQITPRVPVEMVFPIVDSGERRWVHLAAEVVREGPDGVGVTFIDKDPRTVDIIKSVA